MFFFYGFAFLILAVGGILYARNKDIVFGEWALSFGVALLLAIIFHACAFYGMTGDQEIWSGQIMKVTHHPEWVERITHHHTTKDSKGNVTGTYTTYSYDTHPQYWDADSNINSSKNISREKYNEIVARLGGKIDKQYDVKFGEFWSGDHNIYVTHNQTGAIVPISEMRSFENRIQAAPTVFSFAKVPTNAPVYKYPVSDSWFVSERLLGIAKNTIDIKAFDEMSARLGPSKEVNIIIVGFLNQPESLGLQQQAAWIGGKKNDMVICYSTSKDRYHADWVYVFSWSEREICKINLRDIFSKNKIDTSILPLVEKEIRTNWLRKDWKKFDYISISPPTWCYWTYMLILLATQVGIWIFSFKNEYTKDGYLGYMGFSRRSAF